MRRSVDGGRSWIDWELPERAVFSLAVSPADGAALRGLGLAVSINAPTRQIVGALMQEGRFRRAYLGIGGQQWPLPQRLARELGRTGCVGRAA